uniref:Uncharacterized protein n=1 Tax=Anguilla anguilla TaxID=7936 RepID=A0A0E9TPZ9_ANGAN
MCGLFNGLPFVQEYLTCHFCSIFLSFFINLKILILLQKAVNFVFLIEVPAVTGWQGYMRHRG